MAVISFIVQAPGFASFCRSFMVLQKKSFYNTDTRLYRKESQLEILKATEKAPTSIRKIVPGPSTVPTIIIT